MKKRILFLILFCFSSVLLIAQEKDNMIFFYDADWNKVTSKKNATYTRLITFYEHDLHHPVGLVKDYYLKSGKLQWEGSFSYYDIENEDNNKEEGKATWYHENGNKSTESYFDNGELYGVSKQWHENGKLEVSYEYHNGELDGKIIYYNNKGILSKTVEYKKGKVNGFIVYYYTSGFNKGNPRWEREYLNGKPKDKWALEYDEYGQCTNTAEENFYDNSNDWSLGYNSDKSCYYSIDTVNQNYSITTHEAGLIFPALINVDVNPVSEYVIDASLKLEKGERYSILFGFRDWDNYMSFDIYEEDKVYFKINKIDDGIRDPIIEEYKELEAPYYKGDFNRIQIRQLYDKEEGEIKFLYVINKEPLGTTPSPVFLKGFNFGFSVSGGRSKITADYIKLKYPCGDDILEGSRKSECKGYGSGFAINNDGYIATNYHVVKECKNINVIGIQGDTAVVSANIILSDSVNDLAIIKVNKWLGDIPYRFMSAELGVLEEVYAYGYPRIDVTGFEIKATNGTITSTSTKVSNDERYYQHTAPIQSGNSGGPLFDENGNIVGINTLAASALQNVAAAVKTRYLIDLMSKKNISMPRNNYLFGKKIPEQYKNIKDFVYLIVVED